MKLQGFYLRVSKNKKDRNLNTEFRSFLKKQKFKTIKVAVNSKIKKSAEKGYEITFQIFAF